MEVTRARIALAEENWTEVLALHDAVVQSAERPSASRLARVVEMSLLKALALEALGEREAALDSLEKGAVLAAPEGAMLTFLEFGRDLAVLLRALKDQARSPQPYAGQLLRLFPATADSQAGLVEPLSARELEVLRLIASGKSNKEIAVALTVTLNTVKKHSSHIYGKLGVNGRTQAVARARELDLL
jgi:LuxR family maltose regulon positive regulatory protein